MAIFEIASFGAIVVLVVLGLGIIASMMGIFNFAQGEFVLLGAYVTYIVHSAGLPVWLGMVAAPFVVGALGFVLERLIVRRFYAAPIVAMLGTYALGLDHSRDRARPDRRTVSLGAGARRRFGDHRRHAFLNLASGDHRDHRAGDGRELSASGAHCVRPAHPRFAGEPGAGAGLRHFDQRNLWRNLRVRRRALAGLAGALIVPVFTLFADLGIRFLIQGFVAVMVGGIGSFAGPVAGAGLIGTLSAALPWVISPVIADVAVFVLAIIFIKFRPQGLVAGKGV